MKLYRLESVLKSATDRRVWMKSGGYLVIEPTEALTVIDVNTGKYTGKKTPAETILKINLEAAHEVARQLSLRNLSGIIIVDFIDMESKEDQETLMRTAHLFAGDLHQPKPRHIHQDRFDRVTGKLFPERPHHEIL